MDKAVEQVEREITKILSERFGIVSDGWTHKTHSSFKSGEKAIRGNLDPCFVA